jgi:DNA-binding LacI/PurR family transcriptional regulator
LLEQGHRLVHHVAIPSAAGGRQDALAGAGIAPLNVIHAGWQVSDGYEAGGRLAGDPGTEGALAVGVRRTLHDAGKDVTADVSFIGFDDVPGAPYWTRASSKVRMDFVALGNAADDGGRTAAGRGTTNAASAPPVLIERESTASVRVGRTRGLVVCNGLVTTT